jgi:hypothetical protein
MLLEQELSVVGMDTARRLAKAGRLIEQQQTFDARVAAVLDRILMNAPPEALRPLAKQLRKRIKEIATNDYSNIN